MDTINLTEIFTNNSSFTSVRDQKDASLASSNSDRSLIFISEINSTTHWELPPIYPQQVYKLKWWQYLSHSFIKIHSVNIPFTANDDPINVNILDKHILDSEKKQDYLYAHLGVVKFGLNPLIRIYLPISSLCCVIATRHNKFLDALIGDFQARLCDGLLLLLCIPNMQFLLMTLTFMTC